MNSPNEIEQKGSNRAVADEMPDEDNPFQDDDPLDDNSEGDADYDDYDVSEPDSDSDYQQRGDLSNKEMDEAEIRTGQRERD